ncbi:hypothetical protein GWK16_03930 [Roseomonas sp. JC162]|uniref:Uncharacterized protein n=1 Tax=Neoroseomonas marina TaxID=1232220 RepID=A0A848E8G6_9PROT|nr:hypothetical protein [Neoroseomonas marina]NMJ40376.1 hypothetical protein [Neoroseomonas marina]
MANIESPRPAREAARIAPPEKRPVQEPPTGRALWPTFMRRTLEEEQVRAGGQQVRRAG